MDAIVSHSRDLIEKGSKSFAGAARLFDPETRASAYMLYAWCRHCDDVIDDQVLGFSTPHGDPVADITSQRARLSELEQKTREAMQGRATEPVFLALQRVVERHGIPPVHPLDLLEGFRMDVEGEQYETLEDTLKYCYHVAGVVGVMMAMIMGVRERPVLDRASDLGLAFQMTNIARDVVADAAAGRVYLPAAWLREAGLPANDLTLPQNRARLFAVTNRLLTAADRYYDSAAHGLSALPFRSAWAIASARRIYRSIGEVVRARGARAWDTRARVGTAGKLIGAGLACGEVLGTRLPLARPTPTSRQGLWTRA